MRLAVWGPLDVSQETEHATSQPSRIISIQTVSQSWLALCNSILASFQRRATLLVSACNGAHKTRISSGPTTRVKHFHISSPNTLRTICLGFKHHPTVPRCHVSTLPSEKFFTASHAASGLQLNAASRICYVEGITVLIRPLQFPRRRAHAIALPVTWGLISWFETRRVPLHSMVCHSAAKIHIL